MPVGAYGPTYGANFLSIGAVNIAQGISAPTCGGNVTQAALNCLLDAKPAAAPGGTSSDQDTMGSTSK
eukprot:3417688-Ditylum_brightwellii.AAC.1